MYQDTRRQPMGVAEILATAKDTITVRRVFGEPYEVAGVTIVPVAVVSGGGGGGGAQDGNGGEGGGFGMNGRPAGAYIIQDGRVSWQPAVDVTRLVTVVGAVAIAFVLSRPRVARAKGRSAGR
jgi:uncharacterized spore protein YtfJ